MIYEQIIQKYMSLGKRREAGFVRMYYIENKDRDCIVEDLYLNSVRTYYRLKRRISKEIGKLPTK